MIRLLSIACALALLSVSAFAQSNTSGANQTIVQDGNAAGVGAGNALKINLGEIGGTAVVNGGTAGTLAMGGQAAHAATAAGNPQLIGAYVESLGAAMDSSGVIEGEVSRLKADPEGRLLVRTEHPNTFTCAMTSTAVVSTLITGCGAPGAGVTRYITDISYASSIISTTANFMTLQYGTGSNCATGATPIWRMFNSAAFLGIVQPLSTPLKLGTNTDLCFLHPGAGTRVINIIGYTGIP